MVGAERLRRTGLLSALLALPRSEREERRLRERALESLRAVGCEEVAERRPDSLPFATQKRVAFARALAAGPSLLLLDEPAGSTPGRSAAPRDPDTRHPRADERDSRRAPHGLRHFRLRPSRRARLRSRDLHRTAGDGALGSARARGISRQRPNGGAGGTRCLTSRASSPTMAPCGRWMASPSRSRRERSRLCSARTERARRRCCARSRGSSDQAPGASRSPARTSRKPPWRTSCAVVSLHVPEGRGVIAELTVEENLRLGGLWRGQEMRLARATLTTCSLLFANAGASRRRRSRAASDRCSHSGGR